MKMNKKGAIEDVVLIAILLFVTAIVFLFAFFLQDTIASNISPAFENITANSSIGITAVTGIFHNTLNYVYLAAFMALLIALCITAFMTPTHPIFYVFSVIIFIALMIVSVIMSNVYESVSGITELATAKATLTIPDYIMGHLPLISIAIGVLLAVILFSRSQQGGAGGTIPMQ